MLLKAITINLGILFVLKKAFYISKFCRKSIHLTNQRLIALPKTIVFIVFEKLNFKPTVNKKVSNKTTMNSSLKFFLFAFIISVSTQAQQIKVSFSGKTFDGVFSGKVLLYLSKDSKSPKDLVVGIPALSCFAITVNQIKPNAIVIFDDAAISYPVKLSDLERGEYYVQAVWDRNMGGRNIGNSPGNIYSEPIKINLTKNTKATYNIQCDQIISKPTFKETEFVKEIKVPSSLLSAFYKRAVTVDAAVILPKEYYK